GALGAAQPARSAKSAVGKERRGTFIGALPSAGAEQGGAQPVPDDRIVGTLRHGRAIGVVDARIGAGMAVPARVRPAIGHARRAVAGRPAVGVGVAARGDARAAELANVVHLPLASANIARGGAGRVRRALVEVAEEAGARLPVALAHDDVAQAVA